MTYSSSPGTYILTGSSDRSIRLYNPSPDSSSTAHLSSSITSTPKGPAPLPQGKLIQAYTSHSHEVLSLCISASNASFVSSGGDRTVFLWDVATATTTRRFGSSTSSQGHSARVNCVAFAAPDDAVVISGSVDTTVRLWDVRSSSARPIQVLSEAKDSVTALAVTGDAEFVAASVDGRVRTYDVRAGRVVTETMGASVTSLCLARDDRTLLVGSLDSKVRLMDRSDGRCLRTYSAPDRKNEELRVQSVLGGGDRYVVSGDEMTSSSSAEYEGRVWAWDLLSGEVVAKLAVPWGSDGRRKTVLGRDGRERARKNVVSCLAWKQGGGPGANQFCVGGTSGAVVVFGEGG